MKIGDKILYNIKNENTIVIGEITNCINEIYFFMILNDNRDMLDEYYLLPSNVLHIYHNKTTDEVLKLHPEYFI